MIKVILLKDAEANRGVVFAKAVVEQNGFSIDLAVGYIKKDKQLIGIKGSVAMELPDSYIERLAEKVETFTVEATETTEAEVRQITYISIN